MEGGGGFSRGPQASWACNGTGRPGVFLTASAHARASRAAVQCGHSEQEAAGKRAVAGAVWGGTKHGWGGGVPDFLPGSHQALSLLLPKFLSSGGKGGCQTFCPGLTKRCHFCCPNSCHQGERGGLIPQEQPQKAAVRTGRGCEAMQPMLKLRGPVKQRYVCKLCCRAKKPELYGSPTIREDQPHNLEGLVHCNFVHEFLRMALIAQSAFFCSQGGACVSHRQAHRAAAMQLSLGSPLWC